MTQEKLKQANELCKEIAYKKEQLEILQNDKTELFGRNSFDEVDLSNVRGLKEAAIDLLIRHIENLEAEFDKL